MVGDVDVQELELVDVHPRFAQFGDIDADDKKLVLDADIDLGALLDGADGAVPALEAANQAVALIEASGETIDEEVFGRLACLSI